MRTIKTVDGMRAWTSGERGSGRRIAFVPTMGALHEGHLSLMRRGKEIADSLVASIYVNPTQFGPGEDLDKYPKSLDGDLAKCEGIGVDAVFVPTDSIMYPDGFSTYVDVGNVSSTLCGKSRPTHFRGVATVVAKLLNLVDPHVAIFGEKDYQQLLVIRRMVRDLEMPVEIASCPIVREPDGLAMSSRNRYLNSDEREAATSLSKSLNLAAKRIEAGEIEAGKILGDVRDTIEAHECMRIDYARLVDADTLADLREFRRPALVALAAFAGNTRLIDNRCFR